MRCRSSRRSRHVPFSVIVAFVFALTWLNGSALSYRSTLYNCDVKKVRTFLYDSIEKDTTYQSRLFLSSYCNCFDYWWEVEATTARIRARWHRAPPSLSRCSPASRVFINAKRPYSCANPASNGKMGQYNHKKLKIKCNDALTFYASALFCFIPRSLLTISQRFSRVVVSSTAGGHAVSLLLVS